MVTTASAISIFVLLDVFSFDYKYYVNCDCVHPPVEVAAISLHPIPRIYNETYLLDTDLKERRELCKRIHVSERLRDKYAIFLPQDEDFYVAPAHGYTFDDGNDFRVAVRCPTIPVMYVSMENKGHDSVDYSLRIQKSRFGCYNFSFENVKEVSGSGIKMNSVLERMLEESILFRTGVEDRWKLCRDARDLLRFIIDWNASPRSSFFSGPRMSIFWHSLRFDESEFRCAFRCPTTPDIYLSERPGSRNHLQPCSEILISVVGTGDVDSS